MARCRWLRIIWDVMSLRRRRPEQSDFDEDQVRRRYTRPILNAQALIKVQKPAGADENSPPSPLRPPKRIRVTPRDRLFTGTLPQCGPLTDMRLLGLDPALLFHDCPDLTMLSQEEKENVMAQVVELYLIHRQRIQRGELAPQVYINNRARRYIEQRTKQFDQDKPKRDFDGFDIGEEPLEGDCVEE
ncbi:hypothetical protein G7046_g643 [Stylonectria norvegica]|nr:hypothetical protein G7046_g643 [Stylonectria norvegica]